jgi:hypothetical protein
LPWKQYWSGVQGSSTNDIAALAQSNETPRLSLMSTEQVNSGTSGRFHPLIATEWLHPAAELARLRARKESQFGFVLPNPDLARNVERIRSPARIAPCALAPVAEDCSSGNPN